MNRVDCELACGCWQRIRIDSAKVNAVTICLTHGETVITGTNLYEWHVRCRTLFCNYGRWVGASRELAAFRRDRHAQSSGHSVGMTYDRITWDGRGTVYREDRDKAKPPPQPTEPLKFSFENAPPF